MRFKKNNLERQFVWGIQTSDHPENTIPAVKHGATLWDFQQQTLGNWPSRERWTVQYREIFLAKACLWFETETEVLCAADPHHTAGATLEWIQWINDQEKGKTSVKLRMC